MTRSVHTMVWRGSQSWTVSRKFVGSRILLIGPALYRFELRAPTLNSDWIRRYIYMSNSPAIQKASNGSRNRHASQRYGLVLKCRPHLRSEVRGQIAEVKPVANRWRRPLHSLSR